MILGLSTDTWTAIGSVAGLISVLVTIIALVRPGRSSHAPEGPSEPRPQPTSALPDFDLNIAWGWPTYDDGTVGQDSITLTLYNRRHHSVKWSSASIELPDGRHMPVTDYMVPPGMALPLVVDAQDNRILLVAVEALRQAKIDLEQPIAGRATLGTGEVIRSEQQVFEPAT